MRGEAHLVAVARDGRTDAAELACSAPLALRIAGSGRRQTLHVCLLHTSAGFLEGDRARILLDVGEGAGVVLTTPGATIAYPCAGPDLSLLSVRVRVAEGGVLAWLPEPLVAACGCRHVSEVTLDLAPGAIVLWREEVCAGRSRERGGSLRSTVVADCGGVPLLRDACVFGSLGWEGPRTMDGARAVGSVLLLGTRLADDLAAMQLAGPGSVVRAAGRDALQVRRALEPSVRAAQRRLGLLGGEHLVPDLPDPRVAPVALTPGGAV